MISKQQKLEFYNESPKYMGLKFYKKLPQQTKIDACIKSFRNKISYYFTDKAF